VAGRARKHGFGWRGWLLACGVLAALACNPRGEPGRPGDRATQPTKGPADPGSDQGALPDQPALQAKPALQPKPTQPAPAKTGDRQKAEANAPASKRRTYRVLALGDSITDQRVGGGGYLRELSRACPKSRFEHFGRGGDMTNQMRRRFEQEFPGLAARYDTLIVYGGVNDLYSDLTAGRTNDRIEEDLSAIYRAAQDRGLYLVAITVSPWGGFSRYFNERRSQSTRLLNAWILGTASSGETDKVVDSYPLLSCGDPEKLCPDYETPSHDGLHPGAQGHALLGQALLEQAFADCE